MRYWPRRAVCGFPGAVGRGGMRVPNRTLGAAPWSWAFWCAVCEAATDVGVGVGRGIVHILAEKASTRPIIPTAAEVRPPSQSAACEAATDVRAGVGLRFDPVLAEKASTRPVTPCAAEVRPPSQNTTCEAATDIRVCAGRGINEMLAEKASTSTAIPYTAEVRPTSQTRLARRQPSGASAQEAGEMKCWQKRPAPDPFPKPPPRSNSHP